MELGTCHSKPRGIIALFSCTSCINEETARFQPYWSSACLLLRSGRHVCQYNTESSIGLAICKDMQAGVRRHLILDETMECSWHSTYTPPPPPTPPAPQALVSMDAASVMIYNQQQCTVLKDNVYLSRTENITCQADFWFWFSVRFSVE